MAGSAAGEPGLQGFVFGGGTIFFPDQSEAVVYRRDPHPVFQLSPLTIAAVQERLTVALRRWVEGPIKVTVVASPEGLRSGHLERVTISLDGCRIKGVPVAGEVIAEKPWINLYRLWDEQRLGLLAFESLHPSVRLRAADVQDRLKEVRGLTEGEVLFSNGSIRVRGRFRGIPVGASVHLEVDRTRYPGVTAVLDRVSLFGVPLPGWLIGKAHRQTLWTYPLPRLPRPHRH